MNVTMRLTVDREHLLQRSSLIYVEGLKQHSNIAHVLHVPK